MKSKKNIYADVFCKKYIFGEKDHLFSEHRHLSIPTDDKFQKSRNNVAFQVAQVAYSYGALMIGSKKSRNNSCLSPANCNN